MTNNALRNLAINARTRLMNGGKAKSQKLLSPNVKFKIISNDDEEFIERMKSLSEEDVLTPLKKLIDEEKFSKLDEHNKEKYLFDVIDKYTKLKDKMSMDYDSRAFI